MPHKSKQSVSLTQGFLACGPQTLEVLVDKNAGASRTSDGGGDTSILLTCNGNEGFPSTMDITHAYS